MQKMIKKNSFPCVTGSVQIFFFVAMLFFLVPNIFAGTIRLERPLLKWKNFLDPKENIVFESIICGGDVFGWVEFDLYAGQQSSSQNGAALVGGFTFNPEWECPNGKCFDGEFHWIQFIHSKHKPQDPVHEVYDAPDQDPQGQTYTYYNYLDGKDKNQPFYVDPKKPLPTGKQSVEYYWKGDSKYSSYQDNYTIWFLDSPHHQEHYPDWEATLALVCVLGDKIRYLKFLQWGFERDKNSQLILKKLNFDVDGKQLIAAVEKGKRWNYTTGGDDCCCVPEPTTMLLVGAGLLGLAGLRKKFSYK
jgi:hypothetical protein